MNVIYEKGCSNVVIYPFIALYFLGLPDSIIYRQQGFLSWLPFILVIGQSILAYGIARTFSLSSHKSKGVAAIAILILGPLWGIYIGNRQQKQLSRNGKIAIGVVSEKWKTIGSGKHEWLLRCKFEDSGMSYSTFSEADQNNIYHVGDTLHVLYSRDNPTNCVIIELQNK